MDKSVEAICQKGCRAVAEDIRSLEAGTGIPETEGLDAAQIERVLQELREVMAVYERSGSCSS